MTLLFLITVTALGAIVGSFLNVVIHRYPLGESIVFPASHCPHCQTVIKPWDNIPVLSWLILLGRCRACRGPISPRYPLVELANALFYLAIFQRTGLSWGFVPLAAIASMTICLIFIDADIQILPDVIDLPGIAIGLGIGALHLGATADMVLANTFFDSLTGALLGGGILWAIALIYQLLRKVEGMGLGDVKMLAMIGAVTGWEPVLPVLFVASITGAIFGVAVALRSEERFRVALPFGVFLGFAFFIVMFFGAPLYEWYLSLLLR
jgi:leader peptidase (prepilin peptidase)/N-methyltransferase